MARRTLNRELPAGPAFMIGTNWGKTCSGWWWGVWQDARLVGFGAGYRMKKTCFRDELRCRKRAEKQELPAVKCECPYVVSRGW